MRCALDPTAELRIWVPDSNVDFEAFRPPVVKGFSGQRSEVVQTYFVDVDKKNDQVTPIIDRALAAIAERSLPVPGSQPTTLRIEPARDLLDDLDEVLGAEAVPCAEVPALLKRLAPRWLPYQRLTGIELRTQLADLGVKVASTGSRYPVDPVTVREALARSPPPTSMTTASRVRSPTPGVSPVFRVCPGAGGGPNSPSLTSLSAAQPHDLRPNPASYEPNSPRRPSLRWNTPAPEDSHDHPITHRRTHRPGPVPPDRPGRTRLADLAPDPDRAVPLRPVPALPGQRQTPRRPVLAALPTVQGHRTPDPPRAPGLGLD